MIRKLLSNSIVKNASWIMIGRICQMIINLFVGLITARYLGPTNYGLINYANAYTAFFMAFSTLGINSVIVKEFIDFPADEGEIIGSSLLMRAISSFFSVIMILCLVSIIDTYEKITIIVTFLCSLGLFFNIFEIINYWFQSKLQSKITAMVSLVAYIITAGYKVILLILGKSVEWFALATSLDYVCVGIMLLFCYRKHGGSKLKFSKEVSKRIISKSMHFVLPSLMVAIYGYTDKIMLKQMLSVADVGYYSTATSIATMWCFVLSAIIDSIYPSIMEAHNQSLQLFEKRNKILYAIVFYMAIVVSILFCVFGEIFVNLLYGEQYLPAVGPLRVITWYTAFSYLGIARNAWIVSENKQKYLKYIYISSAICNIFMNVLLIPYFGGTGAAAASLITQILTTLVVPFFIKPLRKSSILIIDAIRFNF